MLLRRGLASLAILIAAPAWTAQPFSPQVPALVEAPLPNDPSRTTVHRLENGLTVYLSPYAQEPRITAWIVVRAGGAQDPPDLTGMAHYLEHMLFKGTTRLGTTDYAKEKPHLDRIEALYDRLFAASDQAERDRIYAEIDRENAAASKYAVPNEMDLAYRRLGFRNVNAFTGDEATTAICEFPSNRAGAWALMEEERFGHPVFRLFQTEIETVYEEKNLSVDDPDRALGEALDKVVFKDHPYSRPVLGLGEHLKNPNLRRVAEFYGKNYVPGNMAVAVAGDFDRAAMLALIRKHLGKWKPGPVPENPVRAPPPLKGTERVEVRFEAEEKLVMAWLLPPADHPDRYALQVMDMLMDNSTTGIINLELNQKLRVKGAGSYPAFSNQAGAWVLWALPKKGQTLAQADGLLLDCLGRLKGGRFTDEDISAVVTNFEISEKSGLESNQARVARMTGSFAGRREWRETVGDLDRLRAVRKADVIRVARQYIGEDRAVAVRRNGKPDLPQMKKPQFTKVEIDPNRHSAFYRRLVATPAPPIEPRWLKEGRDYTIARRPWGELYAGPNPVNDLFALTFAFYVGERERRGMDAALGLLGLSGGGDLEAAAFKKRLYALGTWLGYGSSERFSWVGISGLDRNLEESIRLMFSLFRTPRVPKDALPRMAAIAIGTHEDNKKDPGYIYGALAGFAERGTDSPVLRELTDAEWRAIREKDLLEMAGGLWRYRRKVQYVGNRSPDEIAKLVDEGRAEYLAPPPVFNIARRKPGSPAVFFTHRDMVQSQVGIFVAGEVMDPARAVDAGFYASYMYLLAHQEAREARALAYSAWAGYAPGGWKGDEDMFVAGLETQADKTIEALELMRSLLLNPPMQRKRFDETKATLEERYRSTFTRFRDAPSAVLGWEEAGITGGDPRPARFKRTLSYRMEDLAKFAKGGAKRPVTVYILGNRERVDMRKLETLGQFEEKKLKELFPY